MDSMFISLITSFHWEWWEEAYISLDLLNEVAFTKGALPYEFDDLVIIVCVLNFYVLHN